MSTEEKRALVQQSIETFNTRNLEAYFACFASDFDHHMSALSPGIEGQRQLVSKLLGVFPDFHITLEETVVEGNTVAARVSQGPRRRFPGTDESVTPEALYLYRIVDGKIVELRNFRDTQEVVAAMMG